MYEISLAIALKLAFFDEKSIKKQGGIAVRRSFFVISLHKKRKDIKNEQ